MTTRLHIKVYLVVFAFILGIALPAQATTYVFTGIDFPDSTSSHATNINNFGNITGVYTAATGTHGYYLTGAVGGTFTTIDIPEATLTFVYGINNLGNIVGRYQDTTGKVHGFYLPTVGGTPTTIDFSIASYTAATAINDYGNIVGFSNAGSFYLTGVGGSFTPITYPGALGTNALGINNTGNVTGWYVDTSYVQHGFYLPAINGSFTNIDYPGSVATQVFRVNNSGNIVGNYTDTSGLNHGFYLTGVGGSFTTIDFPGATSTYAEGINDSGIIVGRYVDTSGVTHGFIAVPVTITTLSISAKLRIFAGPPPSFELNASFTLGGSSDGVYPLTEDVTLQVGTYNVTIPAGSFTQHKNGKKVGAYTFSGIIDGVTLSLQIAPPSVTGDDWSFKASGTPVDLTGLSNPVTVMISIGDDSGTTAVNALF